MPSRRAYTAALRHHAQLMDQQDQENNWRKEKATDLVAFNAGAETHFVDWLTIHIHRSRTHSIDVAWLISNAAYDLDVSVLTIKRYLQKHTADRAPFKSNGKSIRLRTGSKNTRTNGLQPPDTEK